MDSNQITRDYFDSLLLETRYMEAVVPSITMELYGERFSSPIMTAALSHLKTLYQMEEEPMVGYARCAARTNSVHWIGMMEEEEVGQVIATGARTIRVVKPFADEDKIMRQLCHAEEKGALAVGMDIDHIFDRHGNPDVVMGEQMEPKSIQQMKAYVQATHLPFVVKGVLSVHDAVRCAEAGARGIVVSHHGGRLQDAVPPLMALPEIRRELGADMPIFVDCGVCSGMDAYKALALGATAVSVGRHLISYLKEGTDRAAERIEEMSRELKGIMASTGVRDVNSFDAAVLHHGGM